MEHPPHHSPDDDPRGPEIERLYPGEIDLTGRSEQEDALSDVIYDAIAETEDGSQLPDWGARTLGRALANQLENATSGALHHFAVTGRIDWEPMMRELSSLYFDASDDETRDWATLLGTYITDLEETKTRTQEQPSERRPATEIPIGGTPVEQVTAYLDIAFAEADARGEAITPDDARAVATLLASLLPPDSQMSRFATTGDAHPALIHDECQHLKEGRSQTSDIGTWVGRLEQHLAARTDLGRQLEAPGENPQVIRGIREHGDAFRAYLRLPDVSDDQEGLLLAFTEHHLGSFASIDDLLNELTEIRACRAALDEVAARHGFDSLATLDQSGVERMARMTWDIVEIEGRLYVFLK